MSFALLALLSLGAPASRAAPRAADSAAECWIVAGGGCGCGEAPRVVCAGGDSGDSGGHSGDSAVLAGGGSGCGVSALPSLLACAAALLALLRRRAAPLLALLALPRPASAADAQALQDVDGGTFLALQEPAWGARTGLRASLATSYARDAVVRLDAEGQSPWMPALITAEPAFALDLGGFFQLGAVWPQHAVWLEGEQGPAYVPGDLGLRVGVPLVSRDQARGAASWSVQLDLPRGGYGVLLGDRGAVKGTLAAGYHLGALEAATNLGLRLQEPTRIPGSTWGNRLELGIGLSRETFPGLDGSLELLASGPLGEAGGGTLLWPVELLGGLRRHLPRGAALRVGGGVGLGRGVGAPAWRLVMAVDLQAPLADRDADGLVDLRDACPRRPEDRDRHRDLDGCPDPDNDQDGLPDPADVCPDEPETRNRFEDADGCPDTLTLLRLRVTSPLGEGLEQATVQVGELPARAVLPGEWLEERVATGSLSVRAAAPGHQPLALALTLPAPGTYERELALSPIKTGELQIRLQEPGGAALSGQVEIDGALHAVGPEGLSLELPIGAVDVLASAPQHAPARAGAELRFRASTPLTLTLAPVEVDRQQNRLTLAGELGFALDESTLRPEDLPLLEALARWLAEHPEVRLLRVEGHADETGTPDYNYRLSLARAEAVRAWLVEHGVSPERLQAIGTGEAVRARDPSGATRRVDLLVLIWDETPP